MLFKQWNEVDEPRHHLDSPTAFGNEDSLQEASLPVLEFPQIYWSHYTKVFFTTAIMEPLFPKTLLNTKKLGDIKAVLTLNGNPPKADSHSWNFEENFPNELNPEERISSTSFTFLTPVVAFGDTLLIMVKENFLKVSPIIYNQLANELVSGIICGAQAQEQELRVLGTSDRITELKSISDKRSDLRPPEFVTGFVGSILTQLIVNRLPFQGLIAPSEGATGFEKMSMETVPELIDICSEWIALDLDNYKAECYRQCRRDGAATGSLSGLYI